MKAVKKITGKGYRMITLLIMMMVVISCGGGGGQNREAKKKLEETKRETVQSISKIKIDIQDRIKYVDEELKEATGEVREELQSARRELEAQTELLEVEMEKVKDATIETWNDVIKGSSQSIAQARKKVNEISKHVREMLDGE